MGYQLPVVNFNIDYKKPAYYDDELIIETTVVKIHKVKIVFRYNTYNTSNEVLNYAETTLVFVDSETGKPCLVPKLLTDKFKLV